MTDNEKRAHDLAIAILPIIYQMNVANGINNDSESGVRFDCYVEYKKAYEVAIDSFNRDFS